MFSARQEKNITSLQKTAPEFLYKLNRNHALALLFYPRIAFPELFENTFLPPEGLE